ncbi:hypothetical protein WJX74_004895 [Apatococcus lobatus]|uniref:Uncharacterized protein n=1 Tax=Apatococcus lobatus TaxID=904363 RepID=A0AAW1SFM0_9CHLO
MFPVSKRLASQQSHLAKQGQALASRGYASEPSAAQDPNYIAYGAAGVAAVGLIWYFTSSGSGKKAEHKAEGAAAKAGEAFQADGKVGKQFNADGAAGGAAQAVGGPFDKDGAVGKQFTKEGAVGGSVQEGAEKVEHKAKK